MIHASKVGKKAVERFGRNRKIKKGGSEAQKKNSEFSVYGVVRNVFSYYVFIAPINTAHLTYVDHMDSHTWWAHGC